MRTIQVTPEDFTLTRENGRKIPPMQHWNRAKRLHARIKRLTDGDPVFVCSSPGKISPQNYKGKVPATFELNLDHNYILGLSFNLQCLEHGERFSLLYEKAFLYG